MLQDVIEYIQNESYLIRPFASQLYTNKYFVAHSWSLRIADNAISVFFFNYNIRIIWAVPDVNLTYRPFYHHPLCIHWSWARMRIMHHSRTTNPALAEEANAEMSARRCSEHHFLRMQHMLQEYTTDKMHSNPTLRLDFRSSLVDAFPVSALEFDIFWDKPYSNSRQFLTLYLWSEVRGSLK